MASSLVGEKALKADGRVAPASRPKVRMPLGKSLLFAFGAVLLFFVCAEVVLRFTKYGPTNVVDDTFHAGLLGDLAPGQDLLDNHDRRNPYHVQTNSHGLRDEEFPVDKGDRFRILVLGDSVTYGHGNDNEDTWPKQLQHMLNARDGKTRFHVINAGVCGYSIADEHAYLREKGIKLSPDLVILCFVHNDVEGMLAEVAWREYLREGSYVVDGVPDPERSRLRVLRRSAVYNFLRKAVSTAMVRAQGKDRWEFLWDRVGIQAVLADEWKADGMEKAWRLYRDEFVRLAGLLKEEETRWLLLLFPHKWQFQYEDTYKRDTRLWRALHALAEEQGGPVVDLIPAFQKHADLYGKNSRLDELFLVENNHQSKVGSRVMAAATLQRLLDGGLVPKD